MNKSTDIIKDKKKNLYYYVLIIITNLKILKKLKNIMLKYSIQKLAYFMMITFIWSYQSFIFFQIFIAIIT